MGPYAVCGLSRCHHGFVRIQNQGPILGDHRIYVGDGSAIFRTGMGFHMGTLSLAILDTSYRIYVVLADQKTGAELIICMYVYICIHI